MNYKNSFFCLCLLVLSKALLIILLIRSEMIGLGPDEAQYWTWSRDLSLGYYSKPPGIAWQIWLGCQLFGDTELGVRIGAVVIGTLLPLAVFALAKTCRLSPSTAFWAGAVMALSPLGLISSLLAITDDGMVLFWTLACIVAADALANRTPVNYFLLGLILLGGALFKWTIYYFWLIVIVTAYFNPSWRNWKFFGGVLISLIGLLPSIMWNAQHNWVTFRHVLATIQGGSMESRSTGGNFWAFIGEQVALISPVLFILLLLSLYALIRNRKQIPSPIQFCGWSFAAILGIFILLSLFKKMQGNWCDFAYPMGILLLCWYAGEIVGSGRRWLLVGTSVSILICLLVLAIPKIQASNLFPSWQIPYKVNPFRHNLGWHNLQNKLREIGYDPYKEVLIGDKYQTSSILSFYNDGKRRAYFLNLQGTRKNQFSFWPGMKKGSSGYFVITESTSAFSESMEKKYENALKKYFGEVRIVAIETLFFSYNQPVKQALIIACKNYNGLPPQENELY